LMKTKAIWFLGPKQVGIRPLEVRAPGPGQALVEIKACGICAMDTFTFSGVEPRNYPFIDGHEGVGVIQELGGDVTDFAVGDKVVVGGGGSFARHVVAKTGNLFKLTKDAVPVEWIVEPVACVVNGLNCSRIQAGDRVALIGCGFMGLLLAQGLTKTLAAEVIAIDPDKTRLEIARRYGLRVTLDPTDPRDQARLAEYKKKGMDVVIEAAPTDAAIDLAGELLRRAGRFVLFSWHHGRTSVDTTRWHLGGFEVLNASPMINPNFNEAFRRAIVLMELGVFDLKSLLTHSYAFSDPQGAFTDAFEHKGGYIKGVIDFER